MADRVQLNAMTTRSVGDRGIVNSLRGDFWADGREAIVTETHQQHSTNGYRAVTVTVLRVEGKYPRQDDLTIPNEWFDVLIDNEPETA